MRFFALLLLLFSAFQSAKALPESEIQRFIDEAIKAGGGEVVIPPGVHVIEHGLIVKDAKKLRIVGLDAEESILKAAQGTGTIIFISGTCEEVRIEKLTFNGGWAAVVDHPDLKSPNKFAKILVGRCFFENQKFSAILFPKTGIENLEIDACSFRDIAKEAVCLGENASGIQITHNHFTRCSSAVMLAGSQKGLVASNEISDCRTGILVTGPRGKETMDQGNIIALNAIERSLENGILINSRTLNNSVIQNEIRDSKGDGIRLFGEKHVVKANRITGSERKNIAVIEGKHEIVK
ncbi:right-handed parallel beta-helix repeat-containing protein [Prosthecobacter sp.]|uniref:right-handed parallel beta-helix repeat-containing protein n=1 Tax=Prosthecobacter sp. TaxID=1965333 RepID=UPI001D4B6A1C|nr:right-handed parallel beta-helix repeat-containing protein [Prosthecobacter sp.]MCB1279454.1 right-handed parallel beta-helix repeat-containing protein [Prosthecobacter sp.]